MRAVRGLRMGRCRWLRGCGITVGCRTVTPTRSVHRGRFLDKFPAVADAACAGVLSAGQSHGVEGVVPGAGRGDHGRPAGRGGGDRRRVVGRRHRTSNARCGVSVPKRWSSCPNRSNPIVQLRTARTVDGLVGRFVLDDAGAVAVRAGDPRRARPGMVSMIPVTGRGAAPMRWSMSCAFFNANHDRPGQETSTPPCRDAHRCRHPRRAAAGVDHRRHDHRSPDGRDVVV